MTVQPPDPFQESNRRQRSGLEWPWALLPVCLSAFFVTALVYYRLYQDNLPVGSVAQVLVVWVYRSFGFAPSVLFFLLLLVWSSIWWFAGEIERPLGRLARITALTVLLGVLFNLGNGEVVPALHKGELGAWLALRLVDLFGYIPTMVAVLPMTLASFLLATDFFFSERLERLRGSAPSQDCGVEAAAADRFRELLQSAQPPVARESAPLAAESALAAAERTPAVAATAPAEVAPAVVEEPVDVQPAPDEVESPRYQRWPTAYERRLAAAAGGAPAVHSEDVGPPELWLPTAPEEQEIDNPEARIEVLTGEVGPVAAEPAAMAGDAVAGDPVAGDLVAGDPVAGDLGAVDRKNQVDGSSATEQSDGAGAAAAPASPAAAAEVAAGPVVELPRPEPSVVQRQLFAPKIDEALLAEAIELVRTWRRASATLLQRRLRIDYQLACQVLAALAARGVIELAADATQGHLRET